MRITQVSYRKLISGTDFTHKAIEATATVGEGESATIVLQELQAWVHKQLDGKEPMRRDDLERLRKISDDLRGAVESATIPF